MLLQIRPLPPFDFNLSATIFAGGDPQIRTYENGTFCQVFRVQSKLTLVTINSRGTVAEPELSVELHAHEALSSADTKRLEGAISTLFNLQVDLNPFYDEVKPDPVLSRLTTKLRGLKSPTTPTVFEALVDSIIEQQIALNVAHRLEVTVIKRFGDTLDVDEKVYYAFPTPEQIASATVEQLRKCGLSMRKAEYIQGIASSIVRGELDLEHVKAYEDADEIIRELTKLRGVGRWTAELTMLRGMQRLDALPADDLGLRRHIAHFYCHDRPISGSEARLIGERWGRWKGLAAYYLIMAHRLGVEIESASGIQKVW
jgi:DNA-3-methyladenine glycosylase II